MGVPTMDQQWLNTYREEIGGFSNTIHSFAQGEIARKDYKAFPAGLAVMPSAMPPSICCGCACRAAGSRRSACTLWHRLFSSTMCHS